MVGIIIIAVGVWMALGREIDERQKKRLMVQFVATGVLGVVLQFTGHIDDAGSLEGLRVAFGLIGLVAFWVSIANLFRFLSKLPKKTASVSAETK